MAARPIGPGTRRRRGSAGHGHQLLDEALGRSFIQIPLGVGRLAIARTDAYRIAVLGRGGDTTLVIARGRDSECSDRCRLAGGDGGLGEVPRRLANSAVRPHLFARPA